MALLAEVSLMVLLEFSVSPLGKGDSVSPYVARSLKIIAASGLDYRLHAMGTIIEGELDQVLKVLADCMAAMAEDCDRVTCTAKLDYRAGHSGRLQTKVQSVLEKVDGPLKTIDDG
ncbi:MAG: MTH1187 family thiamine-binding protein [Pirellulaceae bacterium]